MNNRFLENFSYFMLALAKLCVKVAIFCVIIYFIGMKLFSIGHTLFYEKAMDPDNTTAIVFEINDGDTVDTVADNLKKAGLIDDTNIFKFRAKIYKTKFIPNAYSLNKSMTVKNMLDIFDSPKEENIVSTEETDSVYQLAPEADGND